MGINAEQYVRRSTMQDSNQKSGKTDSGTAKDNQPGHVGGDHARKAQQWDGGSKASKGPITKQDKQNPNSSAKS
jgi:hypothetical protein